MTLVGQWRLIEQELPEQWREARLVLTVGDEKRAARAAAVLAPTGAGRHGKTIRFSAVRGGGPAGTEGIRRLLRRLAVERVDGELSLETVEERERAGGTGQPSLASAWDAEEARLSDDWSDALVQLDFVSSDLERSALLLAPLNPSRHDDSPSFRFRAARVFGYGASPGMVRRCLERLDHEGIRGSIRILRVLSDTDPVATQGPVWYVGGRPV